MSIEIPSSRKMSPMASPLASRTTKREYSFFLLSVVVLPGFCIGMTVPPRRWICTQDTNEKINR